MRLFAVLFLQWIFFSIAIGQKHEILCKPDSSAARVRILDNGRPFTTFIYGAQLEKPILFPLLAPDGATLTRGFPLEPRKGEPADHPHHIGLWMNYENVNGIDFWNNSSAVPAGRKQLYGRIVTIGSIYVENGPQARLIYHSKWLKFNNKSLINEKTEYIFQATDKMRIIDRVTTLTAVQDILFKDAKDGFLGIRVAHELELTSREKRQYVDDKGNLTTVEADSAVTGNYLTSEKKEGESAWGTRADWCLLYGKIGGDTVSLAILDHPDNPGYPCYWHARGYGLFAANPLGQKIFSNNKEELNLTLRKGESVTFRYRILIASGRYRLSEDEIKDQKLKFEKEYRQIK